MDAAVTMESDDSNLLDAKTRLSDELRTLAARSTRSLASPRAILFRKCTFEVSNFKEHPLSSPIARSKVQSVLFFLVFFCKFRSSQVSSRCKELKNARDRQRRRRERAWRIFIHIALKILSTVYLLHSEEMHSERNCRLFISLDIVKLPPKDIEYKIELRRADKSRNCAGVENISVYDSNSLRCNVSVFTHDDEPVYTKK